MSYTIKEAAVELGVTTVRIHGLLNAGQLELSSTPVEKGGRYVKAITTESVEAYKQKRETRSEDLAARKEARMAAARRAKNPTGAKQYVLTLTATEVADLAQLGIDLRPRHGGALVIPAGDITPVTVEAEPDEDTLDREEEFLSDDDEDLQEINADVEEFDLDAWEERQAALERTDDDNPEPEEVEPRRLVIRDEAAELLEAEDQYDAEGNYIPYNERQVQR